MKVFEELRRHAAELHGVPLDEIVIEITGAVRLLRVTDERTEVLESRGARDPHDGGILCVLAGDLARRAQSDVCARQNALAAAKRAFDEATRALATAERRHDRLAEIAHRAAESEKAAS